MYFIITKTCHRHVGYMTIIMDAESDSVPTNNHNSPALIPPSTGLMPVCTKNCQFQPLAVKVKKLQSMAAWIAAEITISCLAILSIILENSMFQYTVVFYVSKALIGSVISFAYIWNTVGSPKWKYIKGMDIVDCSSILLGFAGQNLILDYKQLERFVLFLRVWQYFISNCYSRCDSNQILYEIVPVKPIYLPIALKKEKETTNILHLCRTWKSNM